MADKEILSHLQLFFPECAYNDEKVEEHIQQKQIDISKESLINTIKGALFDETILEVEIHNLDQIFFCRVLDNPYDDTEVDERGNFTIKNPYYEPGSYLDYQEKLFITPLEPSRGNIILSSYNSPNIRVLLRIISSGNAVELCCFYETRSLLGDMPCLQVTFPLVAKKSTKAREFRAKVPKSMKFAVTVERLKKKSIVTVPLNISLKGMALLNPMQRKSNLVIGEKIVCTMELPREKPVTVNATVIHVTNLRNAKGTQFCFGIIFHFRNQSEQKVVENIMAQVQRIHLRELAEIESTFGITYDR
jgi:hypothetical protein